MIALDARRRDMAPDNLNDILARFKLVFRLLALSIEARFRPDCGVHTSNLENMSGMYGFPKEQPGGRNRFS